MWQIIRDLVAGGVTIFLTTQYLEEADQLADRIAVLDHGRIVAEGTPAELKRLVPGGHIRLRFADAGAPRRGRARVLARRRRATTTRSRCRCPSDGSVAVAPRRCSTGSTEPRSRSTTSSVHTPDLDDVFLALTGPDRRECHPMTTCLRPDATRRRCCAATCSHMRRYPA